MTADPRDPLGYDLWVGPTGSGVVDMTPDGRSCSGVELVTNAMIYRLMADELPLVGAPGGFVEYGTNVRKWVGEAVNGTLDTGAKSLAIALVLGRDPRLDPTTIRVVVTVQPAGALYNFNIEISAKTTTELPIALVLGVNSVTVDLLAQGR